MFSKATLSLFNNKSKRKVEKLDLTADIPEPTHKTRRELNVPTYPYSKRHLNPVKSRVKTPRPSQFVDLYSSDYEEPEVFISNWTRSVDVPRKKRRNMSTKNTTPNNKREFKEVSPDKDDNPEGGAIVDLTKPPSLETIEKENKLYFTYDPRGFQGQTLPKDYCTDCRCPSQYCSDLVFGKCCYRHVEIMVAKNGFDDYKKENDILWEYMNHFNDQVHCKMVRNNISYGSYCLTTDLDLPDCMKKGTYQLILHDIKAWKERDNDHICDESEIDSMYDDAYNTIAHREVFESMNVDMRGQELKPTVQHNPDRTAIEQASDVSGAFKAVKKYVESKRREE